MNDINVGDKVSWTHYSQSGRKITMSLRQGEVMEIGPRLAKIKTGKRIIDVEIASLRVKGQKSEITEFIEKIREGAK